MLTMSERLESIEKQNPAIVLGKDVKWLIAYAKEQAERVEFLEKSLTHQKEHFEISYDLIEKQNKRYREAIERAVRHLKNLKIEDGANFAYLTLIKALEADEQ